ncbi:MAG: L,D-transpeptidase family protein [Pseudomonadota bacterium]
MLIRRAHMRALAMSAALAAGVLLAGCNAEQMGMVGDKATRPIPDKLLAEIEAKNMDKGSPMLVRVFKQESELEVWKQDRTGRFALLKTYPICRWSGDLGPKVKEGDRQAPEGFYSIGPGQMNPNSGYYLSFNTGFPNAYDRAWGRTGAQLMVHGDCSSRGCYAMTDEQISEIYSLGRESFFGGQTAFQFQAYPFRMTPQNFARYRSNPNIAFWKMLKEGNDAFEVTKQEVKVNFCEKKYVFDAERAPGATRDPVFSASAKCPPYAMPEDVAQAVEEKKRSDELKTAQLVTGGAAPARSRAGIDGGMHPVFASKLPDGNAAIDKDVTDYTISANSSAPGTVPGHATLPLPKDKDGNVTTVASFSPDTNAPVATAAAQRTMTSTAVANANASASDKDTASSGGFFSKLKESMGFKGSETKQAEATPEPAKPAPKAKSSEPKGGKSSIEKSNEPSQTKAAETKGTPARVIALDGKQNQTQDKSDNSGSVFPTPVAPATSTASAQPSMSGSAPTVSGNAFDNRWSLRN